MARLRREVTFYWNWPSLWDMADATSSGSGGSGHSERIKQRLHHRPCAGGTKPTFAGYDSAWEQLSPSTEGRLGKLKKNLKDPSLHKRKSYKSRETHKIVQVYCIYEFVFLSQEMPLNAYMAIEILRDKLWRLSWAQLQENVVWREPFRFVRKSQAFLKRTGGRTRSFVWVGKRIAQTI